MDTVHVMDLNKKTAIMVASAEPIRALLREMVDEADERTRYLAGKVSAQALVNGLILWMRAKPRTERAAAVDEALRLIAAVEQDMMTIGDVVRLADGSAAETRASTTTHVPFYGLDRPVESEPRRAVRRKK